MSDEPVVLYPRFCFDLSPTFGEWCFLKISDLQQLRMPPEYEGQSFYFYKNLPIRWVRLVGLIVAVDVFEKRRIYTLDDSSGAVAECVHWVKTDPIVRLATATATATASGAATYDQIRPGTVVDVRGELSLYNGTWQVRVAKMRGVSDTAAEMTLWEKRRVFRESVLSVPWVLNARQMRRAEKSPLSGIGAGTGSKKHTIYALAGGGGGGDTRNDDIDDFIDWSQVKRYLPVEYADLKLAYRRMTPKERRKLAFRIFTAVAKQKTAAQRKALYLGNGSAA